jgi:hypothetical protein
MGDKALTIDYQDVTSSCPHCGADYQISRGSVYRDGVGVSIYLTALHQCQSGKAVHAGIAVQEGKEGFDTTSAAALRVVETNEGHGARVVDWNESPWKNESYLGKLLTREEVLNSPFKDRFFHILDHILAENPTVKTYLYSDS